MWAESFESVLEGLGSDFNSETLSMVLISSNERIVEPAAYANLKARLIKFLTQTMWKDVESKQ